MKSEAILNLLENGLVFVEMSFEHDNWRATIPSKPGWYFIETDTPPEKFKSVDPPKGRHYNIPKKVEESLALFKYGACILPTENLFYYVYSGEAKNLKARAREHKDGHIKTGCLALTNYKSLHEYTWKFHFVLCPIFSDPHESKLLRAFGEQVWRAKYGWPILCGK